MVNLFKHDNEGRLSGGVRISVFCNHFGSSDTLAWLGRIFCVLGFVGSTVGCLMSVGFSMCFDPRDGPHSICFEGNGAALNWDGIVFTIKISLTWYY